jgi:hypothetical protein
LVDLPIELENVLLNGGRPAQVLPRLEQEFPNYPVVDLVEVMVKQMNFAQSMVKRLVLEVVV